MQSPRAAANCRARPHAIGVVSRPCLPVGGTGHRGGARVVGLESRCGVERAPPAVVDPELAGRVLRSLGAFLAPHVIAEDGSVRSMNS